MRYGITEDHEYNATRKRHRLNLWSGPFRDTHEGHALSTTTGYMITLTYGDKIRVSCPSPRAGHNYREVDAAISRALTLAEADALERHADTWARQAERLERELLGPVSRARDAELAAASWRESRNRRERAAEIRAAVSGEGGCDPEHGRP